MKKVFSFLMTFLLAFGLIGGTFALAKHMYDKPGDVSEETSVESILEDSLEDENGAVESVEESA